MYFYDIVYFCTPFVFSFSTCGRIGCIIFPGRYVPSRLFGVFQVVPRRSGWSTSRVSSRQCTMFRVFLSIMIIYNIEM